jgi:hypothetical protein
MIVRIICHDIIDRVYGEGEEYLAMLDMKMSGEIVASVRRYVQCKM